MPGVGITPFLSMKGRLWYMGKMKSTPEPKKWYVGQEVVIGGRSGRTRGKTGIIKKFYYLPVSRSKGYRHYAAVVHIPEQDRDIKISPWKLYPTSLTESTKGDWKMESRLGHGKELLQEAPGSYKRPKS